jgi:hypothetical protein
MRKVKDLKTGENRAATVAENAEINDLLLHGGHSRRDKHHDPKVAELAAYYANIEKKFL